MLPSSALTVGSRLLKVSSYPSLPRRMPPRRETTKPIPSQSESI